MNGHDAFFGGEVSKSAKGKLAAAGALGLGGGLAIGGVAAHNVRSGRKWNEGAPPNGKKGMKSNEWSPRIGAKKESR